jgi:hypothetical protein
MARAGLPAGTVLTRRTLRRASPDGTNSRRHDLV